MAEGRMNPFTGSPQMGIPTQPQGVVPQSARQSQPVQRRKPPGRPGRPPGTQRRKRGGPPTAQAPQMARAQQIPRPIQQIPEQSLSGTAPDELWAVGRKLGNGGYSA
jgi:hypothetical protein